MYSQQCCATVVLQVTLSLLGFTNSLPDAIVGLKLFFIKIFYHYLLYYYYKI